MSIGLALGGWTIAGLLYKRRDSAGLMTMPFAFYALMETLQALQYSVLDQCGMPLNYALTIVAHILVAVQPLMWNVYRLSRSMGPDYSARKQAIFEVTTVLSLVWAVFFTIRLLPTNPVRAFLPKTATYETLRTDEIMVGPEVCTFAGPTHVMWTLPYASKNGLEANFFSYLVLWFVPAFYESNGWLKFAYWIGQVAFINFTAGSIHELPTTWCALSVPILLLILWLDRPKPVRSR